MIVQRASEKLKLTKFMLAFVFDFPTWIIVNIGVFNEHMISKSLQGIYWLGRRKLELSTDVHLTNNDPNVNTF